jgi:16S rRNA (guanine966-N2)-methyltransferase
MGEQRMRIVAGEWRNRRIEAPKGPGTRPTSDRVREALFSALAARLGPDMGGGAVLDLFAGTGALAFEALSRGAARAVLVERDRAALQAIATNAAALQARDRITVVSGDVLGPGLERVAKLGPFALLFCDPPYRIEQVRVAGAISTLGKRGALTFGCPLVWEHAAGAGMMEPDGFAWERTYNYGDSSVTLMRYYEGDGGS